MYKIFFTKQSLKDQQLLKAAGISAKAKDLIRKEDKSRASYYNYYTSKRWGEMKGYDICLNSSQFGIDNCVDMLYDAVTKY